MMKRNIKVATFNYSHFVEIQKISSKWIFVGGLDFKLLTVLAEHLNFCYEIIKPTLEHWGLKGADGNWTGIIGMVMTKEADIGINSLAISYSRSRVVNFSFPYLVNDATFVTRSPKSIPKAYAFIQPFDWRVWSLLFATFLGCTLLMHLVMKLAPVQKSSRKQKLPLGRTFWYMLGYFLGQGGKMRSRHIHVRIFFAFWTTWRSLMVITYCALIWSYLMFDTLELTIQTFEDLADAVMKNTWSCSVIRGSTYHAFLTNTNSGINAVLGSSLLKHPENVLSEKSTYILTPLKNRNIALVHSRNFLTLAVARSGRENFRISDDALWFNFVGIAVAKDFCCRKRLDIMIHRITAAGLVQKWFDEELFHENMKRKPNATAEAEYGIRPLILEDLLGAFLALLNGYILSFVAFIFELSRKRNYYAPTKASS